MNKSHIELGLVGLCGFICSGPDELLLPGTGRCSANSNTFHLMSITECSPHGFTITESKPKSTCV